ncbi:MAG: tetratricopeptide repeat protein [Roseibium sp.]
MFTLLFLTSAGLVSAQPVPDLGPEAQPPSAQDFDAVPEDLPEEGGQVVVDENDADETESKLDQLYAELSETAGPATRERVTRKIRALWMNSGSDTVDVLMSRSGKAIQADNHALALDLLDVVVILKPSFAEGWNRRATVHYMREEFGRSLVDIERTLALEPRHWGALSGLAIIQRRLGFEADALATFKKALEIHPGLENAAEAVKTLEKAAEGSPA